MTMQFNKTGSESGIPTNSSLDAIFELKEALKRVGWTVPRSGDATTYKSDGDIHASSTSLDNMRAWFEIGDPDGRNHFIFQRWTSAHAWRIKWAEAPFDLGTPDATTVGGAATEAVIFGSGTDASPGGSIMGSTTAARVTQLAVDDAAPWGWWCHSQRLTDRAPESVLFMDPLRPGSFPSGDPNPVVVGCMGTHSNTSFVTSDDQVWSRVGGSIVPVGAARLDGWGDNSNVFPGSAGVDPSDGNDVSIPVLWGRNTRETPPVGWRGYSSLLEMSGTKRLNGDTGTRDSSRDRIYLIDGSYLLTWNGTVPAT